MHVRRILVVVALLLPARTQWPSLGPGGARTAECSTSEYSDEPWEGGGGSSALAPSGFQVVSGACTVSMDGRCFYSPGHPGVYPNNAQCHLQTRAAATLHVVSFETEPRYDFLEVHGRSFNGTHSPHLQAVPAGAHIRFTSSTNGSRIGFEVCAEIFHVASGSCTTLVAGSCFASPNYMLSNYPKNTRCELAVEADTYVQVVDFHTELGFDLLTLNGALAFSGSRSPQGLLLRRGDNITFVSDGTVGARGFLVCGSSTATPLPNDEDSDSFADKDYAAFVKEATSDSTSEHPGGWVIPALAPVFSTSSGDCLTSPDGRCFTSPNYPSMYPNSAACVIDVAYNVMLHVVSFATEPGFDFLEMGGERFNGTTGPHLKQAFAGSSIRFSSDATVAEAGFVICAAHFHVVSGECQTSIGGACFDSPNFPSQYPNNSACDINVTVGSYLHATVFKTRGDKDLLELEGDRVFSGTVGPDGEFVSRGSRISFVSDSVGTHGGFRVCDTRAGAAYIQMIGNSLQLGSDFEIEASTHLWTEGISGDMDLTAPTMDLPSLTDKVFTVVHGACTMSNRGRCIQSPGYPGNYPSNSRCQIRAERNTFLEVLSFSTEEAWDELTLVNASRMTSFSGTVGPEGQFLHAGDTILFVSDASVESSGFQVCGAKENIDATSDEQEDVGWIHNNRTELPAPNTSSLVGVFHVTSGGCVVLDGGLCFLSPGYPSAIAKNVHCDIKVHWEVALAVIEFNIHRDHSVFETGGEKFSGIVGPQLTRAPAESIIHFVSEEDSGGGRFLICAAAFTILSGTCTTSAGSSCFESPNYPSMYPNNARCRIRSWLNTSLDVVAFVTETSLDKLVLANGDEFSGGNGPNSGPQGRHVEAGSIMSFESDGSDTRSGFQICASVRQQNELDAIMDDGEGQGEDGESENSDEPNSDLEGIDQDGMISSNSSVVFNVTLGDCTVSETGYCFSSPNYPLEYPVNSQCSIVVGAAVTLGVISFQTEPRHDYLEVNGRKFNGTVGPDVEDVSQGAVIEFVSDPIISAAGFEICAVVFSWISGNCSISTGGTCFESLDYPAQVNGSIHCRIRVELGTFLDLMDINNNSVHSTLSVDDRAGTVVTDPSGRIYVRAGSVLDFELESSNTNQGFLVCGRGTALQNEVLNDSDTDGHMESDTRSGLGPEFTETDSDTEDYLVSDSIQEDVRNFEDSERPQNTSVVSDAISDARETTEASIAPDSGDAELLGWDLDTVSDTDTDTDTEPDYPTDRDVVPESPPISPISPNCAPTSSQPPALPTGTSFPTSTPAVSQISAPCTALNFTPPAILPTTAPSGEFVTTQPTGAPAPSVPSLPVASPSPCLTTHTPSDLRSTPPTEAASIQSSAPLFKLETSTSVGSPPRPPSNSNSTTGVNSTTMVIAGSVAAITVLFLGLSLAALYRLHRRRKQANLDVLFDRLLLPFDPTLLPQPLRHSHIPAFPSSMLTVAEQLNPLFVQTGQPCQSMARSTDRGGAAVVASASIGVGDINSAVGLLSSRMQAESLEGTHIMEALRGEDAQVTTAPAANRLHIGTSNNTALCMQPSPSTAISFEDRSVHRISITEDAFNVSHHDVNTSFDVRVHLDMAANNQAGFKMTQKLP